MNRRRFLQALAVAPVVAVVPFSTFATPNWNDAILVFVHPTYVRDLVGFVPVTKYASKKIVSPLEIGSYGECRFLAWETVL